MEGVGAWVRGIQFKISNIYSRVYVLATFKH
jgi:hypothetical protein